MWGDNVHAHQSGYGRLAGDENRTGTPYFTRVCMSRCGRSDLYSRAVSKIVGLSITVGCPLESLA